MSYLFEIQDKTVFPTAELLNITPFQDIWERDTSERKEIALKEFAYMEFMSSMKKSNPYKGYPEERRHDILVKDIFKIEEWQPDALITQGMQKIKEFQTEGSATYSYYISVLAATNKIKEFLETVDLTVKNKMGSPVYKPKELTSALIDTEKVLTNLKSIETKVEEELFEESKNRANKQISYFADPETLNRK